MKQQLILLLAAISFIIHVSSGSQAGATGNLRASMTMQSNNRQTRKEKLRRLIECDSRCSQPGATGEPIPYYYGIQGPVNQYVFNSTESPFGNVINCWDTSAVADMSYGFFDQDLNERIDCWDTSNVTTMKNMFGYASSFNQPLNNWDVSKVTDMSGMFLAAYAFNQPLNNWDVSNVKNMSRMFSGAVGFNQPLKNWNVTNVQHMGEMFSNAHSFNQPLNTWNVANVQNMGAMFSQASSFSQNLCSWGVKATSLRNIADIFTATSCPYGQDPNIGGEVTSSWCSFCFGVYNGYWKNVGSNSQQSYTAGASWTNTTSATYTASFTDSFSGAFEESAMFDGTGAKVTLSATVSLTGAVSDTLSYAETHSWTYTCATPVCNNGVLFQFVVEAPASDGTTQSVQTCNFECVPQSISQGRPMCPLGLCSDNTCQCCNDLWLLGNSNPVDNHLEDYNGNGGTCKSFCVGNDQPCDDTVTCCSGKCSKSGICQQNFSLVQVFH